MLYEFEPTISTSFASKHMTESPKAFFLHLTGFSTYSQFTSIFIMLIKNKFKQKSLRVSPSVHPDELQVLLGAVGVGSAVLLLHDGLEGVGAAWLPCTRDKGHKSQNTHQSWILIRQRSTAVVDKQVTTDFSHLFFLFLL